MSSAKLPIFTYVDKHYLILIDHNRKDAVLKTITSIKQTR